MRGKSLPQLICRVYADRVGGILRYKGAVDDGLSVLWEGKWRREKADAIAEADTNAARIDRERRKRVVH